MRSAIGPLILLAVATILIVTGAKGTYKKFWTTLMGGGNGSEQRFR